MSTAAAPVTGPAVPTKATRKSWQMWLRAHIDPAWRPGEWDSARWLFTGDLDNPRTSSSRCRTRRCEVIVRAQETFCTYCSDQRRRSGLPREEFAATFTPVRSKSLPLTVVGPCTLTRDGARCVRPQVSGGLCGAHTNSRKYHKARGTFERWLRERAAPFTDVPVCLVTHCAGPSTNSRGLCNYHWRAWRKECRTSASPVPVAQWAPGQPLYLLAHQFHLAPLPETLRWEVLYAVQQMDQWVRALEPHWIRGVIRDLTTADTLVDTTNADRLTKPHQSAVRVMDNLQSAARAGYSDFSGITVIDQDVIDLRVLGLCHNASGKRRHLPGRVDLREVHQPWLRQALRHWVTTARPTTEDFKRTFHATTIASAALAQRADAGDDPAVLTFADATSAVDAFRAARKRDGTPYSSSFRRSLLGTFFQLIAYGRRCGTLDDLAGTFTRVPVEHVISVEEPNEDFIGKAIPESVIRQLDTYLDTLGTGNTYGCRDIAPDARHLLYRTMYTALRDTGRRPLEIVSLPRDCLEIHNAQPTLIWDNHKRKRHRRRLPITTSTADAIRTWQACRDQLHLPPKGDRYLFPSLTPPERRPLHLQQLPQRRHPTLGRQPARAPRRRHRRTGTSPPLRPVPDLPLRLPPLLRPAPRGRWHARRRTARTDGP
ncbi:hypothetical protein ACWDWU_43410 [Streptomyces sp. NPDC003442]